MWSFLAEDVPGNQPELELEPSPPEGCHRPGTTSQCQSSANLVRSLKHYSIFFRSPTALRFPFRSFISFFNIFCFTSVYFFFCHSCHTVSRPRNRVCVFFTSLNIYNPIIDYILPFFVNVFFTLLISRYHRYQFYFDQIFICLLNVVTCVLCPSSLPFPYLHPLFYP